MVGPVAIGADAFSIRSAKILAAVWFGGHIMQELGLIPSCNLERVVRWAWGARVAESTQDPFAAALDTLRSAIVTRRGVDIFDVHDREDQRYRESIAYVGSEKKAASGMDLKAAKILFVPTKNLPALCGGQMGVNALRDQMRAVGLLIITDSAKPKPSWGKLPDGTQLSHYRVDLARLAAMAGGQDD